MAPTLKLVCFSFAAYAKTLMDHLRSLNVPILPGLTDTEFSYIESTYHFTFPPDLRSILQEGLPIGPHFPNWRSSSPQQLQILLNLPLFYIFKNVTKYNFWVDSWGVRPKNNDQALNLVKEIMKNNNKFPALVPVYRNCYIPATCPNVAGNPVFVVDDMGVRVASFDLTRFFQEVVLDGLLVINGKKENRNGNNNDDDVINVPVWAAKEAKRVEFWTEVAERGRRRAEEEELGWWWDFGEHLGGCLERVYWMLRDGGWKEDEVREIMMMRNGMNGCDYRDDLMDGGDHVRLMSLVLLRAGWSREDVVYSLGFNDDEDEDEDEFEDDFDHHEVDRGNDDDCGGGRMFLEFQPQIGYCSRDREGADHRGTPKHWMNLH